MNLALYSATHFDRGASRLKEAFWWSVRSCFFQNSLPWSSALRVGWLRFFGAVVGHHVVVRANVNISFPWRLTIDDYVWIGEEVMILSLAPVVIESHVCVSQRAFLCTGGHDYRAETFDLIKEPITLRSGCWVAASAFIGPGVEVGEGSVVGAGSVVLRNVPPRTLVRGNPASVVKSLA